MHSSRYAAAAIVAAAAVAVPGAALADEVDPYAPTTVVTSLTFEKFGTVSPLGSSITYTLTCPEAGQVFAPEVEVTQRVRGVVTHGFTDPGGILVPCSPEGETYTVPLQIFTDHPFRAGAVTVVYADVYRNDEVGGDTQFADGQKIVLRPVR